VHALLFDVRTLDIRTYALAAVVLVVVAAVAALLPVWRASSLNPADITRQ
jgi:ABC-type lipoprotein release transport system permease subunit